MIYAGDFLLPQEIESQRSGYFLPEFDSIMVDHAIAQSEIAQPCVYQMGGRFKTLGMSFDLANYKSQN